MSAFRPDCVRLNENGKMWVGVHIKGEGTRWQVLPEKGTIVRPPPGDLRCEVCQRSAEEVERFGGPGDPMTGDYTGAILVKRDRDKSLLGASWECRECIQLTDMECQNRMRMR